MEPCKDHLEGWKDQLDEVFFLDVAGKYLEHNEPSNSEHLWRYTPWKKIHPLGSHSKIPQDVIFPKAKLSLLDGTKPEQISLEKLKLDSEISVNDPEISASFIRALCGGNYYKISIPKNMTLKQPLFLELNVSGYVSALDHGIKRLEMSLVHCKELAMGGTAVGTGINSVRGFAEEVADEISSLTGIEFVTAENKFEALGGQDCIVELSGSLKVLAGSLFKIANDLRWLSSGPRSGIGEIFLPANEPGSSIMPGKVTPTQCEAMTMLCTQVMGNDTTITFAGASGNFELNVYRPVIAYNILQSIRLLSDGCDSLRTNAVDGIEPNLERKNPVSYTHLTLPTSDLV